MCIGSPSAPRAPEPPPPAPPVAPMESPKPMQLAGPVGKRSNAGLSQLRISNRSGGM